MNRGRGGYYTPSPRGRGRGDHRSHNPAGAEPSSSDHMSGDRKPRFGPGSQMSWTRKTVSNQAQPVVSEASAGEGCVRSSSRDRTDCEEYDRSPDCIQEGCVDGHVKSSVSRERSWQMNQRPSGQRRTPWQEHTEWKQARPVTYEATSVKSCPQTVSQSGNSDLLSHDTSGIAKSVVHDKGSAEPSSSDHMSGDRKQRFSPGSKMSWTRKTDSKRAQPVASEASAGQGCVVSSSRDRTDCEVSSHELNNRAEIVGSGIMQSEESDMFPDCIQKGCVDGHVKSSVSRERSWQMNQRPNGQRRTPWQGHTGWEQAKPVSYEATSAKSCPQTVSQSGNSDMSSNYTFGIAKSIVPDNQRPNGQRHTPWKEHTEWKQARPVTYEATSAKSYPQTVSQSGNSDLSSNYTLGIAKSIVPDKGSADGPLDLDRSLMENLESLKSSSHCKDSESAGGADDLNKCDASQHSECAAATEPFDICPPKDGAYKVKPSLFVMKREKRHQIERSLAPKASLLRSGMVLLKNYISVPEQVKVVQECRKLGLGTGGFYQPGYRDGAKLSLRMMCLGKNWDPETSSYDDNRPIDGARPPPIPSNFLELVERSIKESHTLIAEECGPTERVQAILPSVSPDICLVNFYTTSGRLGLHQDRDESEESLHKGLPVVSISIGDKAEFLYGDQGDVGKAEKVTLESGDVLIFGGKSRHVFHGVSSIQPNSAPESLLHATNLRPGRLNLTFREY